MGIQVIDKDSNYLPGCTAEFWIEGNPYLDEVPIPNAGKYFQINEIKYANWVLTIRKENKYCQFRSDSFNHDTTYVLMFDEQICLSDQRNQNTNADSSDTCYCNPSKKCHKIKVKVVDEKGKPIKDCTVIFWLEGTPYYCNRLKIPDCGKLTFKVNEITQDSRWHLVFQRYAENGPLFNNRFVEISKFKHDKKFKVVLENCKK